MNFEGRQPRFTFRPGWTAARRPCSTGSTVWRRKNIGISEESCIQVEARDDLTGFFELMEDTARRDNFYEGSRAYYERLYPMLRDAGMAELTYARYQPKLHYAQIDGQISAIDADCRERKAYAGKKCPSLPRATNSLCKSATGSRNSAKRRSSICRRIPTDSTCPHSSASTKNRFWTGLRRQQL